MKKRPIRRVFLIGLFTLLLICSWSVIADKKKNDKISVIRLKETGFKDSKGTEQVLFDLIQGRPYDSIQIQATAAFLDSRQDTSDFRIPTILALLYDFSDALNPADYKSLKEALLHYKYWITDPGEDSMVYWSENHQILGATGEYLSGQLFPQETFTNTGLSGWEHEKRGKERILTWLGQRWDYGFTEWYSNTYYKEDIAALSVLISYAQDEEVVHKATAILDLLLYDMASQSFQGNFISTSGRAYEHDRKYDDGSIMEQFMRVFWDEKPNLGAHMLQTFLLCDSYQIPKVLQAIAQDTTTAEIKASMGLTLTELKEQKLIGQEDRQIMMQWGMEAFTNPEVIENSLTYIRDNQLFSHRDLHDFKDINYDLLLKLGVLAPLSSLVSPQTNGIAIQRANTYTYRSADSMMYTAQAYFPGTYGDQQHLFGVTLRNNLMIFHNHPAVEEGGKGVNTNSPDYWVGYGHLPHTAQWKNINLSIYRLPSRKGLMEKDLLLYTHAWFPMERFDEASIKGNLAFGRSGTAYIAMIGNKPFRFKSEETRDDLLLEGAETWWITEMGSELSGENYLQFQKRIENQASKIVYSKGTLDYPSPQGTISLDYQKGFSVGGIEQDFTYSRYDSPWIKAERMPKTLSFSHAGYSLYLDFEHQIRETR
jgi:hypothetical protein